MFLYGFNVDYSVAATLRIVIPALWVRPPLVNPIFNMASVRRILLAVGSEVLWHFSIAGLMRYPVTVEITDSNSVSVAKIIVDSAYQNCYTI